MSIVPSNAILDTDGMDNGNGSEGGNEPELKIWELGVRLRATGVEGAGDVTGEFSRDCCWSSGSSISCVESSFCVCDSS